MGAAGKSWAARAQKPVIYCIQVAVKKKKTQKQLLAGPKCPIKYMCHLNRWMGSVHLSLDENSARSLLSNHFVDTRGRRGTSMFWAAFAPQHTWALTPGSTWLVCTKCIERETNQVLLSSVNVTRLSVQCQNL